jgi:hypothetical protein
VGIGFLALGLFVSGCYGPFNLTRRLYRWNSEVGDKWERELVFLVLIILPAYEFAGLADAIAFNSIEFWTGNNPVDAPDQKGALPLPETKRIARGDAETLLTYTPGVPELLVEQFRQGRPTGTLRLEHRDGVTVGADASGRTLAIAQTLADGSILISSDDGGRVARYSPEEVEQTLRAVRQ